ncbi:Uncharacterised protein [Mycobacterium tuberculosis]|uniref:Uncharacterized protein n=1 Tax=Mycobacterium tuberculosis TaxID=1773 RepID=A0A916PH64_MYCTX|nr:Uncharacterised protein [Mycobacterium tuberculosis]
MASDSNSRVPEGAGRTMTKNSSSTSSSPKTAPALRSSRSSVSAARRLVNALGPIGEQRQRPSSRTTATPKPSGVSAAGLCMEARCAPMGAYGSR